MATLTRLAEVDVTDVKGLGGRAGASLKRAGLKSVADLLSHAPRRYIDRSTSVPIAELPINEEVTIVTTVKSVATRRPRRSLVLVEAVVGDDSGQIKVVWFNQSFRARQLQTDSEVALSGKVERFRGRLQMKSPDVDVLASATESLTVGRVVPIHPKVGDAKPSTMRKAIANALTRSQPIGDVIPAEIVTRAGLAERDWSYQSLHFPEARPDADRARDRLVFDELFRLEVALAMRKRALEAASNGIAHDPDGILVSRFLRGLPYELTGAQSRVLDEIGADLRRPHAMHRLLQGEVGSGKTVVAVATVLAAIEGGWQTALMAPTEVLAEQHYIGVNRLLDDASMLAPAQGHGAALGMDSLFAEGDRDQGSLVMALLTGSRAILSNRTEVDRDEVSAAIARGEVDLVIGTHALIQEGLEFARLGLAVVDEQHRFGVAQRVDLRDKANGVDPDLLIMTATPIPRTLSMTLYGDLDMSVIDELPPGRTPIETRSVPVSQQTQAWALVRSEVAAGRQAFVVCPLVDDSPKIEAASATAEFERLQRVFEGLEMGLIHGQLHSREKEGVMAGFRAGDIDVLIATTVIEVGIDVPNATVMVIEDAHRFGLSQLHQLRGRVGRGVHRGHCLLVSDPTTPEGEARIAAMVASNDGFELANHDLAIRGQGTVFGNRQSGMTDLKLTDILRDIDLVIRARQEAFELVDQDPALANHPELGAEIRAFLGDEVEWLFVS